MSLLKQKPLFVTYHNDLTGQGMNGLVASLYNSTFLHLVLWRARKIIITQPKYIERSSHLKLHKKKVIQSRSEFLAANGARRQAQGGSGFFHERAR